MNRPAKPRMTQAPDAHDSGYWRRVDAIFNTLVEISPDQRAARLDHLCGSDSALRDDVVRLLESDANLESQFLEPSSALSVPSPPTISEPGWAGTPVQEISGAVIGPYTLHEQIGEGGFGLVFLAEQQKPVRRRVALKIIKPGMDTRQVVARFQTERQALALMDHPHIARVLDGGETDTGRPYFVMELVRGIPITDYCDQCQLSPRERLELFLPVCQAIQHAHQKGIIHRDLKPSNVMIAMQDGRPSPKVIDFGVAKAINQRLSEDTLYTKFAAMVGTPLYMSPEQAELSPLEVDTRSDIYSLGAMLYELLTGTTPFERERMKEASFDELRRIIRHEEPPTPSSRLSTLGDRSGLVAEHRRTDVRKLGQLMRGDLDWIVMKALEKDRTRRYDTASDFAADVQRYLSDRPVEACPPSTAYRFRKFARRNRAAIATVATLLVILVSGTVGSMWQALRARRAELDAIRGWAQESEQRQLVEQQRNRAMDAEALAREEKRRAQQSEAEARTVLEFFEKNVLAAARPESQEGGLGVDVSIRAAVDAAEAQISPAFADQPLVEASIRNTLGLTYLHLREAELAMRQFEVSRRLWSDQLGPDDPWTLTSMHNLATAWQFAGNLEQALPLLIETLGKRMAQLGPDHRDTLESMNSLAAAYAAAGEVHQALPLLEQTLQRSKAKLGPDDPSTLHSMANLGNVYRIAGQLDRAVPFIEQTLAEMKAKLGPDHPDTLACMNNLALAYQDAGRRDQAMLILEQTLEQRKAKLGPDHPDTLQSMNNLALAHKVSGDLDKAIPIYKVTLEKREAKFGPDHPDTLASMNNLAGAWLAADNLDQALPLLEQTVERSEATLGPDHPDTLASMNNLALAYQDAGSLDKALSLFEATLEKSKAKLGLDHPDTFLCMNNLGRAYHAAGNLDQALPLLEGALHNRKAKLGPDHPDALVSMNNLAIAYEDAGKVARALPLYEEALDKQKATLGADHPYTLVSMHNLACTYRDAGRLDEAEALSRAAVAGARLKLGFAHSDTQAYVRGLVRCYAQLRQPEKAEPLLRELAAFWRERAGADSPEYAAELALLSINLLDQHKFADAEPLLRECLSIREAAEPDAWTTFNTMSMLGGSLLGQKRCADAEPLLLAGFWGIKQRQAKIPAAGSVRLQQALERLIRLYDQWHAAEPNAGYDLAADKWRREFDEWRVSTQPTVLDE